ncbi:NTP/NDP exchange transporter [Aestuariibacter salexigens]|uniref:NTP/NDP exchange transporter n=1 Tax=Aestuariibacter salexigens TaxID=226010 RepID=UPI00146FAD7F|nr:Npt1/Npt2 family nucleotide transporter [Aestuariibacter salexigens]
MRSYTIAIQALILLIIIPAYANLIRGRGAKQVLPQVTLLVSASLFVFWVLYVFGLPISIPFYVWLGVINVLLIAQFWAYAADIHNPDEGKRLFAFIAAGASIGSLIGAQISGRLFGLLGAEGLMLIVAVMLLASMWLPRILGMQSKKQQQVLHDARSAKAGFDTIIHSRYLIAIAVFVILLNCVNTTGEYILAKWVQTYAQQAPDIKVFVGEFYSNFYTWVNLCSMLIQLFFVSRIFRLFHVHGALIVLPFVALIGYGMATFIPIFTLFQVIKIAENSIDYSLQNTARHALFLPLSQQQIYEGKTVIDALCWRIGDLVHVGIVFIGFQLFNLDYQSFAAINFFISIIWVACAIRLANQHKQRLSEHTSVVKEIALTTNRDA